MLKIDEKFEAILKAKSLLATFFSSLITCPGLAQTGPWKAVVIATSCFFIVKD